MLSRDNACEGEAVCARKFHDNRVIGCIFHHCCALNDWKMPTTSTFQKIKFHYVVSYFQSITHVHKHMSFSLCF
eukprot:UN08978